MSNNPYLHVIIRVPKSASTTLQTIVTDAFPNARLFPMLGEVFGDNIVSRVEKLRALRKIHRAVWKNYRVITTDAAWEKIDTISNHGDIVSGHFGIHEVKINNMERRNITLIRNPVHRLLSDYNYSRNGFNKRNVVQKLYHNGRLKASAKYSFEGYISYLSDNRLPFGRIASHFIIGDTEVDDKLKFLKNNYFVFGAVEKMDRFRRNFEEIAGVKTGETFKNRTIKKSKPSLTSRETSVAERFCGEDMELYQVINDFVS